MSLFGKRTELTPEQHRALREKYDDCQSAFMTARHGCHALLIAHLVQHHGWDSRGKTTEDAMCKARELLGI